MDNLTGIKYGTLRELLRENPEGIDPSRRTLVRRLTLMSLWTSIQSRSESRRFDAQVAAARVEDPIFIIGHWRSGTTLLHTLLAQDAQFAYPRIYQVTNPHTFLSIDIEQIIQRRLATGSQQRPMDNVTFDPLSPAEDEFASCPMSIRSHMIGWSFPRREAQYDHYLTFREAPQADYERWRQAFLWFLKKVSAKYDGRRLLLKSPQHTARIKLLLQEFPGARFVHIHRDPYAVFLSTQRLYETGILPASLQTPPSLEAVTEGILRRYREIYDAFHEEQTLIPAGQYTEIKFSDLEQDMLGQVGGLYEQLKLSGFAAMEPQLKALIAKQAGYRKNIHPDIPEPLRRSIYQAWQPAFERWNYPA